MNQIMNTRAAFHFDCPGLGSDRVVHGVAGRQSVRLSSHQARETIGILPVLLCDHMLSNLESFALMYARMRSLERCTQDGPEHVAFFFFLLKGLCLFGCRSSVFICMYIV